MINIKTAVVVCAALTAGAASATILVTGQSVNAHTDGFVSGPGGFDLWNHGSGNGLVQSITVPDSDARSAGGASVSASAVSSIQYLIATAHALHFTNLIDYSVTGNGGGTNTTANANGNVQLAIDLTQPTAYDIWVTITDAMGGGSMTMYSNTGITVGFGAGVGSYHFTGTLGAGTYYWDLNGNTGNSTSGTAFNQRARMSVDAKFSTVPEPASLAAMGLGLLALARKRRG